MFAGVVYDRALFLESTKYTVRDRAYSFADPLCGAKIASLLKLFWGCFRSDSEKCVPQI